jgi:hypothetical protein
MNWLSKIRGALRRERVRRACTRMRDEVLQQRRDSS